MMQVPPQARAGGGEAKEHLETKQEACARDGQIGWAGVRGTTANKANQSRGMRGGRGKASAQGHADEGATTGPTPQAPHHSGGALAVLRLSLHNNPESPIPLN